MKKITLACLLFLSINFSFSQTAVDYLSGLNSPSKMIVDGTTIYVNGFENIYSINTASSSPSANLIYTAPANFYIVKTLKLNNDLLILVENYIESTDTFVGMQIVKLNLANISAGTQTLLSTSQYISSFALIGTTIYYSKEIETAADVYTTNIYSFDTSLSAPTSLLVYADIGLASVAVADIEAHNSILYISSGAGGQEKIIKLDLTASAPAPVVYLNTVNLNFNKGIFITSGGGLYVTNANEIRKINTTNATASFEFFGIQTAYQDTFNGTPFYANFRDVVVIGNTLYMTLEEQGKVLTLTDASLGTATFSDEELKMYPNPVTTDLFLVNTSDFTEFELYDPTGKKVKSGTLELNTISFSQLNTGIYFLKLVGNSKNTTYKILKK